jgi:hypothetical protein
MRRMHRCPCLIRVPLTAALVFCRDSGTEIFVRDYETPTIEGMGGGEQLLETRPDDRELLEAGADVNELD